ncbi:protein PAT1 homolog 2 [Thalassophryne amazonica]|uniref:protein PAT1 homolog 2 n=1 Tax=Thalassophryne amazonica TaxID=390379 RepID=UPI0014718269|nr:protein PAT1 homolog 2 [Thalassophryne amazonica]
MGLKMRLKTLYSGSCSDVKGHIIPQLRAHHRKSPVPHGFQSRHRHHKLELALGPHSMGRLVNLDEARDLRGAQQNYGPAEVEEPSPQWPENGEEWSDEDESHMDCDFLQAMAEEDEDINLYNEETFGMDLDSQGMPEESSGGLLQFEEPPPQSPEPKPPSPRCSPSPPRLRQHYWSRTPPGYHGRGRGGPGRGQMFEDPAVMRIVEGRPSLKSLDSAIVDCGNTMYHSDFEDDWMVPSCRNTQRMSGTIFQDTAIMCVIDGTRNNHLTSNFDLQYPISSFKGRRGESRGIYCKRSFGQRGQSQMHRPFMPGSPNFSREPIGPWQRYIFLLNQTGSSMFPLSRPCPSTPLSPKMMRLHFGANSPRPSPIYSPSSIPVQHFRYPGPVTRLHPQHKRLLSQKRILQRKLEHWDPDCNLMTAKEKEWIIRLQMIQLQSENPYHDDYYYQEYYRRIEAKLAEEELGVRTKREPPKLTTPYITKTDSYTPVVHIEGSLGQVAVSTCYSPRHAISAVHAVQAHSPPEEQKDTRQQRLEVLSKIEKLFMVLLSVEEMERMKSTTVGETEEMKQTKIQGKIEYIYSQLQHHDALDSEGEFLPFLLISKGKKLIARLLPFLKHETALNILCSMTSKLPTLMSRDADEALLVLYTPLRNVIGGLTFSQLIGVLRDLTTSESPTYDCLALACQNKFGLSLLYVLLSHGEKLLSSGVPLEPSIGDFETWTDTIFQVAGQLSQSSLVEPLLLPSNLLTLFCRYLDKRTIHQLKSNMESATGFLALPS